MVRPGPEALRLVERERPPSERVVITGFSQITPLGRTEETWMGLIHGDSGARVIDDLVSLNHRTHIGAPLQDEIDLDSGISDLVRDKKNLRRLPRLTKIMLNVAKGAAQMAGITDEQGRLRSDINKKRVGVTTSSGIGNALNLVDAYNTIHDPKKGSRRVGPFDGLGIFPEEINAQIAMQLGLAGWTINSAEACATSLSAVVEAVRLIKEGRMDIVIAGGGEEVLDKHSEVPVRLFAATQAVSMRNDQPTKASRPFDQDREGFVLGSGGAVVTVERLDTALARGANILAEVLGYEKSIDGYEQTDLDVDRVAETVAQTIYDIEKGKFRDVDAIFAHATSTKLGDKNEVEVLRKVFGGELSRIPITAIKSSLGHLAGGAGIVNMIAALCAMRDSTIPPILNLDNPDEGFEDLLLVREDPLEIPVNNPLVLAYGFGGHNAVVHLGKYKE